MKRPKKRAAKRNAGTLKKVTKSTGWLKADGVRFVRNKGKIEVYIRRKARRKKTTTKTKRGKR